MKPKCTRTLIYKIQRWSFLSIIFSPFKPLYIRWYVGKIRMGHPYFYPRRIVKLKNKQGYRFKDIKYFGFCSNGLGWKPKFNDIRFEWSPAASFILLGIQFYVSFGPKNTDSVHQYWEAWVWYDKYTDKKLSKNERLLKLFELYSCTWTRHSPDQSPVTTDYFPLILRKKHHKLYEQWQLTKQKTS